MSATRRALPLGLVAALLVGGAGLAWAVFRAGEPESGPAPVAWDRQACARCRMLVSEPGFAAQLRTRDGDLRHYDDPGCLLLERDALATQVAETWFHHVRDARWIPGDEVVFDRVDTSPMGYGLAARARAEGGTLDLAAAAELVQRFERTRSAAGPGGRP